MKQKNKLQLFVTGILAMFCISAATAQSNAVKQQNVPVQSREHVSKQQQLQQNKAALQNGEKIVAGNSKMQPGKQPAKAIEKKPNAIHAASNSNPARKTQIDQRDKLTQLMIQRKEALDKGQPIIEINKAIQELTKPSVQ